MRFSFERTLRTASSEQWVAFTPEDDEKHVAVFDVHFTGTNQVKATLITLEDMPQERLDSLIGQFDDDVIESADISEGNFELAIFVGTDKGVFNVEQTTTD